MSNTVQQCSALPQLNNIGSYNQSGDTTLKIKYLCNCVRTVDTIALYFIAQYCYNCVRTAIFSQLWWQCSIFGLFFWQCSLFISIMFTSFDVDTILLILLNLCLFLFLENCPRLVFTIRDESIFLRNCNFGHFYLVRNYLILQTF